MFETPAAYSNPEAVVAPLYIILKFKHRKVGLSMSLLAVLWFLHPRTTAKVTVVCAQHWDVNEWI